MTATFLQQCRWFFVNSDMIKMSIGHIGFCQLSTKVKWVWFNTEEECQVLCWVCLSVCLSARITWKPHRQTSQNCMSVAQSGPLGWCCNILRNYLQLSGSHTAASCVFIIEHETSTTAAEITTAEFALCDTQAQLLTVSCAMWMKSVICYCLGLGFNWN